MALHRRALMSMLSLVASVGVATGSSTPATAPVSGKDPVRRYRRRGATPGTGRFDRSPAEQDRRLAAAAEKRERRATRNLRIAYTETLKQGR